MGIWVKKVNRICLIIFFGGIDIFNINRVVREEYCLECIKILEPKKNI